EHREKGLSQGGDPLGNDAEDEENDVGNGEFPIHQQPRLATLLRLFPINTKVIGVVYLTGSGRNVCIDGGSPLRQEGGEGDHLKFAPLACKRLHGIRHVSPRWQERWER